MPPSAPSILIVDDVAFNLLATEAALAPLGLRVVTARSGAEALKRLLDEEFAAVLLDVQMPDMDGFETARLIRARDRTRDLPILFLTAIDRRDEHLDLALRQGMADVIYKPVPPAALQAKVSILVRLYEQAHSLKEQGEQLRRHARAERSRFQATFDVAPLGIGYLTPSGQWLRVNPRLCDLLGYADHEFLALPLQALVHRDDVEPTMQVLARLTGGEREVALELRLVHRTGSDVWVRFTGSAVRGEAGEAEYLLVMVEPISGRKQLELAKERLHQQVDEQRRMLTAVLRQMPAGALVVEAGSGRVLLANEQARSLLGEPLAANSRDSLVGAGGLSGPLLKLLGQALSEGAVAQAETITLESRGGERRTVEVSVAPVLGEDGRPAAAVAVLHDVTAMLSTQEELREASAFRERFMAILGHDLRSPLNAAMLSVQVLAGRDLPGDSLTHLQRIDRACHSMRTLIHDLLDVSRARQAGGIPVRKASVDLSGLCQRVVDEVCAANPGAGVELVAPPTQVDVDEARMTQVITNLLANAVRHRRDGTPVQVRLSTTSAGALLEVHNQGEPIPAELLPHLFDAFRRGEDEEGKRARTPGLGLGLYIAQQIVEAHGGRLSVLSSPANGTTFSVELPALA